MIKVKSKDPVFTLSPYSKELDKVSRNDYCKRLIICGMYVCPFGVEQTKLIVNLDKFQKCLPNVTKLDILDFLYYTKSRNEGNRNENLKSMERYKKYENGYVIYKVLITVTSGCVIVLGKVLRSMSITLKPRQLWIALDKGGGVITAHCDCPNRLSYICSHVGALLYCIVQIKEESCTSREQVWGRHDNNRKTLNLPTTIAELKVSKHKTVLFPKSKNVVKITEEKFKLYWTHLK